MPSRSPAQQDVEDPGVRSKIIREATRLFANHGFAAVSIQAIADAVRVAKPTVVYHFGSKDSLQRSVLGELIGHWRDELPRLLAVAAVAPIDGSRPSGPRLDSVLSALFDFFRQDRNRARLALRAMIDAPDAMRSLLREALQPWSALLGHSMRDAQAAGTVRAEVDPEAFALVAITGAIGILAAGDLTNAMFDPEPTIDAQLAELIRVCRIGLLVPRK